MAQEKGAVGSSMTETIKIDPHVIDSYAHAAFASGYALYGPDVPSERSKHVCSHVISFAEDNIHDTNILKFVESKGAQQGLFDELYVRRDRLWMKYDRRSKRWVKQFAQDVPKNRILDVVKRFAPMTSESDVSEASFQKRRDIKQAILTVLTDSLKSYTDLESTGRAIAVAAMAEGAAEGSTAASALIQQLVGKNIPNLDDLRDANLKRQGAESQHWLNADVVLNTQLSGLAGDLAKAIIPMIDSGDSEKQIEAKIDSVLEAGAGSSLYLDSAVHGSYAQSQLNVYERSGSKVDFVTVGDANVCPQCIAIEDKNPWSVDEVPKPPVHANCRCWLAPSGTVS